MGGYGFNGRVCTRFDFDTMMRVCFAGILGMAWVLFLRYYLKVKFNRSAVISLSDPASCEAAEPVPWTVLFKHTAFWSVSHPSSSCRLF